MSSLTSFAPVPSLTNLFLALHSKAEGVALQLKVLVRRHGQGQQRPAARLVGKGLFRQHGKVRAARCCEASLSETVVRSVCFPCSTTCSCSMAEAANVSFPHLFGSSAVRQNICGWAVLRIVGVEDRCPCRKKAAKGLHRRESNADEMPKVSVSLMKLMKPVLKVRSDFRCS